MMVHDLSLRCLTLPLCSTCTLSSSPQTLKTRVSLSTDNDRQVPFDLNPPTIFHVQYYFALTNYRTNYSYRLDYFPPPHYLPRSWVWHCDFVLLAPVPKNTTRPQPPPHQENNSLPPPPLSVEKPGSAP